MVVGGGVSPTTGREGIVTPGALSPNVLEPKEMRNLMTDNATIPPGPQKSAQSTAISTGQGRITFALPDNSNRATLLAKLREQEREQEDGENLVEFLKNHGEDTPKNKKRVWGVDVACGRAGRSPRNGTRRAAHPGHQQCDAVRGVAQGGQSLERKNDWRAGGQKKGDGPPFVRLKPSYFEWRKVRLPSDRDNSGQMAVFYDQQ